MNRPQEIALVCGHELSRAVRSPKAAILFLLYALVASFSGFIFIHVTGAFDEQLDALRMRDLVEQMGVYRKAVLLFFGEGAADQAWLFQMPPFLLFFYKFNLFFLPAFAVLMGFDQLSGELQTRSLRYLATRAHRSSILLGKVLAQFAILALLVVLMSLGAILFTRAAPEASWGTTLLGTLRFCALTLLVMSTYLSLTALFSTLTRTPLYALIFALCALVFLWILGAIANFDSLNFLRWLTPATYEPALISTKPGELLPSVAAYLAFTALFLGGALARLRCRDL